jgi:hypothetical protein
VVFRVVIAGSSGFGEMADVGMNDIKHSDFCYHYHLHKVEKLCELYLAEAVMA